MNPPTAPNTTSHRPTGLVTRTAGALDLEKLVAMNRAAYPDLVADGVVFDAAQLAAHQAVFAEGQIIVESDGVARGAIATLIVPSARALVPHTWIEITGHGTFSTHEPNGDALYLADVYADPSARGTGVGAALYDALFALCRRKGLARIVAGGRLYGYHDASASLSPDEYVNAVTYGLRKDRVLTSQLRAGFVVKGILAEYLDDWRSGSYATHLVWENPDAKGRVAPLQQSHLVAGRKPHQRGGSPAPAEPHGLRGK